MMKVGCIQMDCAFGEKERNLAKVDHFVDEKELDLLVLPELFNSGYLYNKQEELRELAEEVPSGSTTKFLQELAQGRDIFIVAGLPERYEGTFYNSAVVVGPDGFIGVYRKTHLFKEEKRWFAPGDTPFQVYHIGAAKIGVMICFDWLFPEAARDLALKGADIICHPANLVFPYCQNAMITRALENGVFTITANRIGTESRDDQELTFTGRSQIIDPKGNLLARASEDQEEILIAEIDPSKARDKNFTEYNHLFQDRRADLYQLRLP